MHLILSLRWKDAVCWFVQEKELESLSTCQVRVNLLVCGVHRIIPIYIDLRAGIQEYLQYRNFCILNNTNDIL